MNSKTLKKVLATAGIAYLGVISADTVAFAQAIQARSPDALVEFIRSNAESTYVEDAVRLANAMIMPASAEPVTLRGSQLDDLQNNASCDDRDCGEGGKSNRAGY
jgi:hypothetical protein